MRAIQYRLLIVINIEHNMKWIVSLGCKVQGTILLQYWKHVLSGADSKTSYDNMVPRMGTILYNVAPVLCHIIIVAGYKIFLIT